MNHSLAALVFILTIALPACGEEPNKKPDDAPIDPLCGEYITAQEVCDGRDRVNCVNGSETWRRDCGPYQTCQVDPFDGRTMCG